MSAKGTRIGPYYLLEPAGRSPGATVWLAHRADGKSRGPDQVAVRLLDDPGQPGGLPRLEEEYRRLCAAGGQGAPMALALYSGLGALVMSWCPGVPLAAALRRVEKGEFLLDDATGVEICLRVARALLPAHRLPEPLVHGRLAPSEVFLGPEGSVTLLGWGAWSPPVWTHGLAPEVRRGQPPTTAADSWALGALLVATLATRAVSERGLSAAIQELGARWPAAGRTAEALLRQEPASRSHDLEQVIRHLLTLGRREGGVASIGALARRFLVDPTGAEVSMCDTLVPPEPSTFREDEEPPDAPPAPHRTAGAPPLPAPPVSPAPPEPPVSPAPPEREDQARSDRLEEHGDIPRPVPPAEDWPCVPPVREEPAPPAPEVEVDVSPEDIELSLPPPRRDQEPHSPTPRSSVEKVAVVVLGLLALVLGVAALRACTGC